MSNIGVRAVGGVVPIDPATGLPYRVTANATKPYVDTKVVVVAGLGGACDPHECCILES